MKRIFICIALTFAFAFLLKAQTTTTLKLSKETEKIVKIADKHPKDGKKQLNAANAILKDSISGTPDFNRSLEYAYKALKIAQNSPLKDTLLALSYETLGSIYMDKKISDSTVYFFEKALDAYSVELGRFDPVTNGSKLLFGWMMLRAKPSLGFPKILEAFYDNSRAPKDKLVQNMPDATISLEMALELFLKEQMENFRYALIMLTIDGKKCLLVQTEFWNMEHPLLGWTLMGKTEGQNDDNETDRRTILFTADEKFIVLADEDKEKRRVPFNFIFARTNPTNLYLNDNEARLFFLAPEYYEKVLNMFREFKAKK